jgi:hypothetical protein
VDHGSAAWIAERLGGHRRAESDRWLCRCPVRTHGRGKGDRRPSLSIRDGDAPGRILLHCFAGCSPHDIIAELRARGLLPGCERPLRPAVRRAAEQVRESEPDPDQAALALWRAADAIDGTLAEVYLRDHRGLAGPFPPSLRYRGDVRYPAGTILPALVAAVQRPDRQIVAIQVTFLRPTDGAKARVYTPRITIGALGSGAVRLAPAGETIGLAEGVETALSAMELTGVPIWASLGGQRLSRLTLPVEVRRVILFGDNDDAGRLMAERAAGVYSRQGRAVELRWPPDGLGDWNDALRAQRSAAA